MLKRPASDLDDPDDVMLFTIEQVASFINLGKSFVTRLVSSGAIPSVKIGRARRVRLSELRSFVERHAI